MGISDKVRHNMAEGSWIRRMFEEGAILKQKHGAQNVFELSLGNPIMEPPDEFVNELKRLVNNPVPGMHRYMPNSGYNETREAVAQQLAAETGIKLTMNQVVMTCGAAGALNIALKTILNPGDEVILFAPYFMEYGNYIDNHFGVAKVIPTGAGFMPDLDIMEKAFSPKTRAVIINSPNNPTGVVYPESILKQMGELLRRKETQYGKPIFLISDEPYRKIIFDGLKYPSPLLYHKQSIVCTSHSKDLALPGERIGYLAVNPDCAELKDYMDGFIFCNRILGYVNAPALMQHVVRKLQAVTVDVTKYQQQRDFLYDNLVKMGYSLVKPQGAFYMFPKAPIADDVAFIRELQELLVLTVPGRGFGMPGYFRICYCVDDRTLEGSMKGFRIAAERHRLV
ncbi:MAG: pyridoxal phosphate-dependent aminotransferase [Dehalococcoidales bacterium]|nr:pyridoxal phosphate-dependent aminotransferase [Dehalococcoidales bacterium]